MSEPGGSSTINGVLYQLLGSLDHAMTGLRCADASVANPDITLILEPTGGGGDIQLQVPAKLTVEQWKAKGDQGTWSLQSVIDDVLPDLFLAVRPEHFTREVEFIFKTEGRRGKWSEAETFFQSLRAAVPPGDVPAGLDRISRQAYFPKPAASCTAHELFEKILNVVSEREAVRDEPAELRARKLAFLLGRFHLESTPPLAEIQAQVEEKLRDWVDFRQDVTGKRREACGLLLDVLRKGETRIKGGELLREIGLTGREFRSAAGWRHLCQKTQTRVAAQVAAEGYDAKFEARDPLATITAPVTILAGESGCGKTWRLAALAAKPSSVPVVWVRATGTATETLKKIAWEIWFHGLGRETTVAPEVVAKRLGEARPRNEEILVTVFVDNIQHWAELRDLGEATWKDWRMQLVVGTTVALAQQFRRQAPTVELILVGDFQPKELQRYLDRRGADWLKVPVDIRRTLHRPILARLYCDLLKAGDWKPNNEYELYAGFWRRLFEHDGQAEHAGDAGALRRLVLAGFEAETPYPWPAEILSGAGITDEIRNRLERIGWLRRVGDDRAEIWHDRLLNWAVAEAVAEKWRSSPGEIEPLLDLLTKHAGGDHNFRPARRLSYAAADVLWIRQHETPAGPPAGLLPLLRRLEGRQQHGIETRQIYVELLPTLGPEVTDLILARFADAEATKQKPPASVFAIALAKALQGAPGKAEQVCCDLLAKEAVSQDLAVRLLASQPNRACLDRLVLLHRENLRQVNAPKPSQETLQAYSLSSRALVACTRLDVSWVARELANDSLSTEELANMAYVLSRMPLTVAAPLWRDHKAGLLARLAAGHRRVLCGCIIRFADTNEVDRLQAWATDPASQGVDDGFAFVALARLAPSAAVSCLRAAGRRRLFMFEKSSMRELWLREPDVTSRVLNEWMAAEPEEAWQLVSFFETGPERLHGEPLRQLLRQFESDLRGWTGRNFNNVCAMNSRAEILAKLGRHPAALAEYAAWKNTPLDLELGRVLGEVAGQTDPRFREDLDVVFELLARIGGEGLKIAVTAWVQGADPLFQGWMEYVSLVDSPEVTAGLRRRADSLLRAESSPKQLPWDQSEALILLAGRHDDAKIVETVLRWGEDVIFETLADIRTEGPPMKDADIQPALKALDLDEPLTNRINAAYALGLSVRPDVATRLRGLVETEAFNAKLMTAVLHALSMLDTKDVSLIPALRQFLRTKETAAPAARLLMQLGTPEAVAALGESLLAGEPTTAEHFPWDIQRHLLRRPEWRQRILGQIWASRPTDAVKWVWFNSPIGRFLPEIGELRTAEAEDLLWSLAFPDHPAVHTVGQAASAIKGLAKIDLVGAFHAAELRFIEDEKDREYWVDLIEELDPTRAARLFLRQAAEEKSTWGLWHIALALGRVMGPGELLAALQPMLGSGRAREQIAAVEIAGWQDDAAFGDAITKVLNLTTEDEVVEAAHQARQRQSCRQVAKKIAETLPALSGVQRWSHGIAWGNLSEPLLFTRNNRPADIRETLNILPELLRKKLGRDLQKRHDDQKRKTEEKDRKSRENAPWGE